MAIDGGSLYFFGMVISEVQDLERIAAMLKQCQGQAKRDAWIHCHAISWRSFFKKPYIYLSEEVFTIETNRPTTSK